jgi:tetratricopeptide (TPR) repeat protein
MKGSLLCCCIAASLTLFLAPPLLAQKGGSPPPKQPSQPGPMQPAAPVAPVPTAPVEHNPRFVYGKLLTESGAKLPDSTSVQLECAMQPVKAIHPDLNGTFQFDLQAAQQANEDMSAAVNPSETGGIDPMGGANSGMGPGMSATLSDCDVRISAPGYQPVSKFVDMRTGDVGGVNIGTLVLSPIFPEESSEVSVNSLMIPKKAKKEYEKGEKDLRRNDLKSATDHLEKAVGDYDKFAPAWNDLGRIYAATHQSDKAAQAFTKAIAADSGYVPPYLNLAQLQIQDGQYANAADNAAKALRVRAELPPASFLEALADFKLNRFDAAEQSAREAERGPHQNIPQLHLLLTNILLRRKDFSGAAQEMQAYLKEFPNGQFVAQVKTRLPQVESLAARETAQPAAPQTQPQSEAQAASGSAPPAASVPQSAK